MTRKMNLTVAVLATLLVMAATNAFSQTSGCNCANASLVGDTVGTRFAGWPLVNSNVSNGVELPNAGPTLGAPGPSPRWSIDLGSNTIRIDFVQQPATYGMGSYFTFSSLDPQLAGCPPALISGISVTTNKPTAQFNVAAAATFGPHAVTIQIAPSNKNLDWQAGEYILVKLSFACDQPPPPEATYAGSTTLTLGGVRTSAMADLYNQQAVRNEWSVVSNKDNPYDEVGLQHNQLLAAFAKSDEFADIVKSPGKNDARMISLLSGFCCRFHLMCCHGLPGPYGEPSPEGMLRIVRNRRTPVEILDKLNVSKPVRMYAGRIAATLTPLAKDRIEQRSTYEPFFELERRIAQDRSLGEEDRKKVLRMAATARYSAIYWRRVANTPNNPWVVGGNERRKIDWGEVGFVDGLGGLFSALVGAIASVADVIFQGVR